MKTRIVTEKTMPTKPSVNFIRPLSIINQEACTASKVRPSFITRAICFIFYALALHQLHKTGRL